MFLKNKLCCKGKWIKISMLLMYGTLGSNNLLLHAQRAHPHILVSPNDKQSVLDKISKYEWARKVFDEMVQTVAPYVKRHKTDSEWILSRYLMNRIPGKRYTHFYSDSDGTKLVRYAGDAPFPTVRVSPHKRPPITNDGYSYKMPSIEELIPYDTSMKMNLQRNAPDGKREWVDPQAFVESINGNINELALKASIVYWLTGKEEYATFAADILNQWVRGASYQFPIEGPCRTGFLSIQTLGDRHEESLILSYDFLYDFLREKKYETNRYEGVFQKIAATMSFRGFWDNNWFAAQTPAMVFAALSLEDKESADSYLNFYLNKDTINGSCGHLSLPSVVDRWLTPDGHWKEPGGYHNFPVSSLLISALAMEKNGYNIFGRYPALLQSSYVLLKYSFPNLSAPSIGDTGPVSQSPQCLEIGMAMATKYSDKVLPQLLGAMEVLIKRKGYKRETSGYLGLLSFLPEIPANDAIRYTWPKSGELDFAKCYLQRSGEDQRSSLMYLVQGATYNHNHANGMSMELFGEGSVMGIDPGKGLTYEAPMHVNYYAQWAAHNTVSCAGISSSVPIVKGGGGTKKIGHISLESMEPYAGKEAVSPFCSFTDTRYTDPATQTPQQRTMAIVRISDTSGYYIDIFRSANAVSNEYVYHNIGNTLDLLTSERKKIGTTTTSFPVSKKPFDPPGFRMIQDYQTSGATNKSLIALFSLKENGDNRYMQVLFTGEENRTFYTGRAPKSGTADTPYRNMSTPTLICQQQGEAWKRPFIALYEPFTGDNNFTVETIENLNRFSTEDFTALKVLNKDESSQVILQSVNKNQLYKVSNSKFKGNFGVAGLEKNKLKYLYLGAGEHISWQQNMIGTGRPDGAANLIIEGNILTISCNQQTTFRIAGTAKTVVAEIEGKTTNLPFIKSRDGISFNLPAVSGALVRIN
ncbi:MAG: heparinase II/III domain-containing protein [Ginsengibacter sp.]